MITKKVCLLGSFAVGKTSVVRRFVDSIFSDKYHTTIGVKIDRKNLEVDGHSLQMMIWDIEGKDEFSAFRSSYLRGAAGYLLVIDLTRPDSLKVAREIEAHVREEAGNIPFVLLLNKADLREERRISSDDLNELQEDGWQFLETSAKTGENVDQAFRILAQKLLSPAGVD